MIIRKEIDTSKPLTPEQIKMLEEVEKRPITFDEDCPELTDEQLSKAELTDEQLSKAYRASERKKPSVNIEVSPQTMEKVKALGNSSPSILSKLFEMAINNNDMLKQCM